MKEFNEKMVDKLSGLWIESAEELVSYTCTSKSLHDLAEYLDITDEEMTKYRDIAKSCVPKRFLKELESPSDLSEYSFGYEPPKNKKK
jgi:hypothetical protein